MSENSHLMSPERPLAEQRSFSPAVAISNQLVRLLATYVGRGPTKARTTINNNLVMILFGDTMTRAERTLVAAGEAEAVCSIRRILQTVMRRDAVRAVEEILCRRVIAYMADIDTDANMAIAAFVLEPQTDQEVALHALADAAAV